MKIKNVLKVISFLIFSILFSNNLVFASRPSTYSDLSEKHKAFLQEIAEEKGYVAYKDISSLNSELQTKFNEMKTAAASAGLTLNIVSDYRSYDQQVGTFFNPSSTVTSAISDANIYKDDDSNRSTAKTAYLARAVASAPPGYSEHSTGLAIDINSVEPSFANTPEYAWLKANAGNYGFELSYPEGSTQGAGFEPWHWRYVAGAQKLDDYKGLSDSSGSSSSNTGNNNSSSGSNNSSGSSSSGGPISYTSFTAFPGIGQISSLCELTKALWFIGFAILFISVIGMYMYGGFLYTSSGVNAAGVNKAKEIFTNSTIGLILGLSIYVIINTLNPGLLNTQCNITPVSSAPTGSNGNNSVGGNGRPVSPGPGLSTVLSGATSFPLGCDYKKPGPEQSYGAPRRRRNGIHMGTDLLTGTNSNCPVLAFQDGEVIRMTCNGPVIRHANGLETRYYHNAQNFVGVGDTVTAGEEIGIAGNVDCGSTAPHLHFEILENGRYVNPANVILDANLQPKSELLNSDKARGL